MKTSLLINNVDVDAEGGRTFDRMNPVTGIVASTAAAASVSDAVKAADAAEAALPAWAVVSPNERRAMLNAAAAALAGRADDIVAAMKAEIGATEAWARFNVMLAGNIIIEAASLTTQITGQVIPSDTPGSIAMSVREPAGVSLGIAPWNAPIILGIRAIAMPLACGNTVILKASEICPVTHALIGAAFMDAGFPAGVVNVITNAPADASEIVGSLIDHPAVRRINFTGSTKVGRIIAERAARNLKPVLLELGGKAPLLVLEDADLDEAVKAVAFGAFMNQGQICMSTERVIVVESVAEAFVEKMTAKAKTLIAGDPQIGATPLGAVVDQHAVDHVLSLIKDAKSNGANILSGGNANGVIMSATLVDKVTSEMRLYSEESFGPVTALIRVADEAEAVRVANDSDYGLSAAVFTRDAVRGMKVARQIKSGICHVNGPTVHDEAQMPFGGTKNSGYGRFGGLAGINEFTELRWITIATEAGHYPI